MNTNKVYLCGKNPLKEAIFAQKRDNSHIIEKLYLTKQSESNPEIISLVQSNKISYEVVTGSEIESMSGKEVLHQGVCALLNNKSLYSDLDFILEKIKTKEGNPLFVLLDELEDPHNVGAIIRSAVAFGADAILMPEHDQTQVTTTVIKTASGMNFAIPIVRIGNINNTLEKLKEKQFWIYGLAGDGDTELNKTKFDSPTVLVIGKEGSGIRLKTLEMCDFKISIKTNPLCESLNASVATAVVLYEWRNQNSSN